MEINITEFYKYADPANYSASAAELGNNAGRITWQVACSAEFNLLDNTDKLEAMRKWAASSGGWSDEDIAAWSDVGLNALFIQLVAGDMREQDGMSWEEYRASSEAGQVSGALFKGIDGRVYYQLEGY